MHKLMFMMAIPSILYFAQTTCASDTALKFDMQSISKGRTANLGKLNVSDTELDQLPTELKLHICQKLSVKNILLLSQLSQSWYQIANDRTIWIRAAQLLNPLIDHSISPAHLNIIRSTLTGQAQFTIHDPDAFDIVAIQDDGQIIRQADCQRLGIMKYDSLQIQGPSGSHSTNLSSANGTIRAGSLSYNNEQRTFITTDLTTMEMLPMPYNVFRTLPYAMSTDGRSIVGYAVDTGTHGHGFHWTRDSGMIVLPNSKGQFTSCAECVDEHTGLIGGYSIDRIGGHTKAALWLGNNCHLLLDNLLLAAQYILAQNVLRNRILGMSPNGNALYGILCHIHKPIDYTYWSLVFTQREQP